MTYDWRDNIRKGVVYADAETRGRLRSWKKKLAQNYVAFDNNFRRLQSGDLMHLAVDMVKSTRAGRAKAFEKIQKYFGPGVTLEMVDLSKRGQALAVWSILKPRDGVILEAAEGISESDRASMMQDCVTINYVVVGTDMILVSEGLWTLEIPDHALGRAVERSRLLQPEKLIREAHLNLLDLPMDTMVEKVNNPAPTYIKAGLGCFTSYFHLSEDVSLENELTAYVRVRTWLDEKQLHEDQILLAEKGEPGKRLSDTWLRPRPLVQFVRDPLNPKKVYLGTKSL